MSELTGFLTVVAYDRATGARLWRTDKKPADGYSAAGLRMDMAPDGSLVVAGQANRGFLDWYTVSFKTTGVVRWEAVRDGGLNTDEFPAGVLVLARWHHRRDRAWRSQPSGRVTSRVSRPDMGRTGRCSGRRSRPMETIWATALPSGDVCASRAATTR